MMSPWSGLRSVRCGPQTRVCRCGCVICAHIRPSGLGAEAGLVPPVGLEPTTFGLKVRSIIVWLEYVDVLARRWMYRCDSIASNSAIAGNAGNSGGKGMLR